MYKAVFIDIDGTLLKTDHTISKASLAIIQKLKENNIIVVLVSARPLHGILPIASELGLRSFPIASLNGAYVVVDEKIIFESTIDVAIIVQLHKELQQYDALPIYYQQMHWFAELRTFYTDNEQKITAIPITIEPFNDTLDYWQNGNTGPNKILVIAEAAVTNKIQNNLKPRFINQLNIYTSKPTYLEVMNIDASKLNVIKFLIDRYNIKREETIAIGDNFNDKEMIAYAGTGIAMANAPDEVKTAADYVTETNNNDGVPKALMKFMNL
jgi:Cof subfamily protein (haloacid dehalogenase superfamily)